MKYKLGLDLGSTSLGWAVVELDENDNIVRLVDMGVRIFPDGRDFQSHKPINVKRRIARGMRRRLDRIKLRKKHTLRLLHKYGLDFDISADIARLENPYNLRARAVTEKLKVDELGRVFFHFAQRRGFKSNRKETRGEAGGKLKAATDVLRENMGDDKTLGQFLAESGKYRFSDQFDGVIIKEGAMYPTRDMYLEEFRTICAAQNVSDDMRQELEKVIFDQRPLKAPQIGHCIFEPGELRAYRYTPAFQKWRALQQLNQLGIENCGNLEPLSDEQHAKLRNILLVGFDGVKREKNGHVKLTFAEIKRQLGLSRTTRFNLESESRKEMDVDTTAFAFSEIGMADFWQALPVDSQLDILSKINDDNIEDVDLIKYLVDKYDLSEKQAEDIIKISLEDDVCNVSSKAIEKMLPFLEQGMLYHDAAKAAGYNHSDPDIPVLELLPYYGELAALRPSLMEDKNGMYRTMNATVHIAMNQIRAVVNDLILQYGDRPYAINIEMGRDIHAGAEERKEIEVQQAKNKKENDRIAAELLAAGVDVNRENIQKYKLWELLGSNPLERRCVYTDEVISFEKLYSPNFEIEHILPFSRTLDDSLANKTISRVDANRFKGNRTPDEAFNDPTSKWKYEDVWARAQKLPTATKWRFNRGALDLFLKDKDCIARALNDTRHMTRLAVKYLQHVCKDKYKDKYRVTGMPGKMTALFRDMWHLNWWKDKSAEEKYRGSHIHHAIDAFVVACVGPKTYRVLSKNTEKPENYVGKSVKDKHKYWFDGIMTPYAGFDYYDFQMKCEKTIISYRKSIKNPKSTGTIGCLHEDTAYNLEGFDKRGNAIMSRRETLPVLADKKFAKDFRRVNKTTKQTFLTETGCSNDTDDIAGKFLEWAQARGLRKVRMLKEGVDISSWVPVFRSRGDRDAFHKAYIRWYALDGISDGMMDKKAKKTQKDEELRLREQYHSAALKAYKWYIGGNNFCAEVFEIRADDRRYPKLAGKWQIEVISNYTAQQTGGVPMWRKKYATARRVMSLRINDMVMAEFSKNDKNLPRGLVETVMHQCAVVQKDTVEIVFRVKKISSDGSIYLRPHHIAKESADTKSWCASKSSLQEHKAHKVFVSPTGQILK